jgi:methionine-rich copper-binding protein CopC
LATAIAAPTIALAHSFPKSSVPAANSTLKSSPTEVVITFTDPLEPRFSTIEVTDRAGQRVDASDAHIVGGDAHRFAVSLHPLPAGTYTVSWHATSIDTHKTQGSFRFTIAQ